MYELSDDEKRKIRDEEEAEAERERYRAFIRQQMSPVTESEASRRPVKIEYFIPWGRVVGFTIVVALGIVLIAQYSTMIKSTTNTAADSRFRRLVSEVTPVVTQRVVQVRPTTAVWWYFTVEDHMKQARLLGSFRAAGGWGDDVEVIVATETEFFNWKAGQGANLAWSSMGKKTAGSIEAALDPGKYVIGINNKHSLVSTKNVSIQADLKFQRFVF